MCAYRTTPEPTARRAVWGDREWADSLERQCRAGANPSALSRVSRVRGGTEVTCFVFDGNGYWWAEAMLLGFAGGFVAGISLMHFYVSGEGRGR